MLVDEVVSFLHFALGGRCSIDSDPLLDDEVRLSGLVSTNALDLTPLFLVSCSKLTRDYHVIHEGSWQIIRHLSLGFMLKTSIYLS